MDIDEQTPNDHESYLTFKEYMDLRFAEKMARPKNVDQDRVDLQKDTDFAMALIMERVDAKLAKMAIAESNSKQELK